MKLLLSTLLLSALFSHEAVGQYKDGYYYKKDGSKVVGLIKFNYGGNVFTNKSDGDCSISFKAAKRGKKTNLTPNDICCFVIEKDSFSIVKNFRLNALITYPQDFAKVLDAGKINLYLYYSTIHSGGQYGGMSTVTDWIIEKDGKADKLTEKKFRELTPTYLGDYPELLAKITGKKLSYDDSEKIIRMYNEYWRRNN